MSVIQEPDRQKEALEKIAAFLEFHDRNDKRRVEFGNEPRAEQNANTTTSVSCRARARMNFFTSFKSPMNV
ncbi:hypothetical protein HJFPF1_13586 [Paramyrothecium foliicola]|nr:hypothetical protein HJFPF1_13586 [Paramyrothecium foliicola]